MFALLLTAGCSSQAKEDDHIAIESLYFVSATGNIYNTNSFFITEDEGRGIDFSDWDEDNLESEEATKLIEEIKNIPDNESNTGDLAYHIILVYSDGDSKQEIEKTGYNEFPDNWEEIVSLTNEILDGAGEISDSTDIVKIDAFHLSGFWFYDGQDLPGQITVNMLIEEMPITYETLYNPQNPTNLEVEINRFLKDYYNLSSRQIKQLSPCPSTTEELMSFADSKLDYIADNESTISITPSSVKLGEVAVMGYHRDRLFVMFKYDEFESWMNETEDRSFQTDSDGNLSYSYYSTAGLEEGMAYSENMNMYTDPSDKFIILTNTEDYDIISEVVN